MQYNSYILAIFVVFMHIYSIFMHSIVHYFLPDIKSAAMKSLSGKKIRQASASETSGGGFRKDKTEPQQDFCAKGPAWMRRDPKANEPRLGSGSAFRCRSFRSGSLTGSTTYQQFISVTQPDQHTGNSSV